MRTDPPRYEFVGGPLDTEILWPLYRQEPPGGPVDTIYIHEPVDTWHPWKSFRREPSTYPVGGYYKFVLNGYNKLKSTYVWTEA